MSPTTLAYIGTDLAALALLVGALYLPRHGRRDLTAAYIGVNIGVLAVTLLLSTASVGAGLGLGLFGVLSIIRLRSTEISQVIQLDRAIADEAALTAHLEELLGARVRALEVHRLDLVNDTTLVDVRYRLLAHRAPLAQDAARDDLPFVASPADNWAPLKRPTAARHAGAASR